MAVEPSPVGDDSGECEYLIVIALIVPESVTMHFLDFEVVSRAGKGSARCRSRKGKKRKSRESRFAKTTAVTSVLSETLSAFRHHFCGWMSMILANCLSE
jgi:hypothetical protein